MPTDTDTCRPCANMPACLFCIEHTCIDCGQHAPTVHTTCE